MSEYNPLSSIVKITTSNIKLDPFCPYKILNDSQGIGTGFFIDMNGYILTCAHVIQNAIKILITVPSEGQTQYNAEIISICFDRDIALLRITGYSNTSCCILDDSDTVMPGDEVIAIGYPMGQDKLKFTSGIVSGRQDRYFQTDTPINPGNSGGPLLNKKKHVIGINTVKMTNGDNIGYARPIKEFIVLKNYMYNPTKKIFSEPKLFIDITTTDKNYLNIVKCPVDHGVYVRKVFNHSPLRASGLRSGDIITKFDQYDVDIHGECSVPWTKEKVHLFDIMGHYSFNQEIIIEYWSFKQNISDNANKIRQLKIKFNLYNPLPIRNLHYPHDPIDYEIFGGLIFMQLNRNHLENLDILNDIPQTTLYNLLKYLNPAYMEHSLVIITHIIQGSYIGSSNIVDLCDTVVRVNGVDIQNLNDLRKAILKNYKNNNNNYTVIQTTNNNTIILDNVESFKEDIKLSATYNYKTSLLYTALVKT
jgi:S1-C subfamily serine protease